MSALYSLIISGVFQRDIENILNFFYKTLLFEEHGI